ncbi:fibronectin type III domain-containing protein [Modestobacter lapidis]|nr:fibronectin type III domain-containing protein [Modestobacter lapidis]
MRTASPSRRAAGLLAVATIGMSTAVLSVSGVASATPVPALSFSTVDGDTTSGAVPEGICGIAWRVIGGEGGVDVDGAPGQPGGELRVTTEVSAGEDFTLSAGAAGTGTAGADSVVTLAGAEVLIAAGGELAGLGQPQNEILVPWPGSQPFYDSSGAAEGNTLEGSNATGAGLVAGEGVLCSAPPAPQVELTDTEVGENSITVRFFEPRTSWEGEQLRDYEGSGMPYADVTGYDIKVDGGAWAPITPVRDADDAQDEALYATVTGLTNGTAHTVQLRTTSIVGVGGESAVVTATPVHTYPAPSDVTVKTGVRSLTVSWKAPADSAGITGWGVEAYPQFEGDPQGQDLAVGTCATEADDYNCTFPVKAGWNYYVGVAALAEGDYRNTGSEPVRSGTVPGFVAPTAVPTASAPLATTDADKSVAVGELVKVNGSGYLPGSSVDIVMYSTPQVLATVVADANGDFTAIVTVPEGLADGTHNLVAAGVDEDGNPRYLVVEVTVTGGVAAVAAVVSDSTSLATTGGLAYTGFTALPFVGAGVLALGVGGGLLVVSRRRQA